MPKVPSDIFQVKVRLSHRRYFLSGMCEHCEYAFHLFSEDSEKALARIHNVLFYHAARAHGYAHVL